MEWVLPKVSLLTFLKFWKLQRPRESSWNSGIVTRCVSKLLLGGTTAMELFGAPEFEAFRQGLLSPFNDDNPQTSLLDVSPIALLPPTTDTNCPLVHFGESSSRLSVKGHC